MRPHVPRKGGGSSGTSRRPDMKGVYHEPAGLLLKHELRRELQDARILRVQNLAELRVVNGRSNRG